MRLLDFLTADRCRLPEGVQTPGTLFPLVFPDASPAVLNDLVASLAHGELAPGILAPHARVAGLGAPVVFAVLLGSGLAPEFPGARFCFVFLTPLGQPEVHLQILSHLGWMASQVGWAEVMTTTGPDQLFAVLAAQEAAAQGGYVSLGPEVIYRELETGVGGLSAAEAARRLALAGPNVLARKKDEGAWVRFGRNLVSVFALLLWTAGALCFVPGVDMPPLGWAIFSVVLVNALFSYWQDHKAGRAVEALQRLIPHESRVRRGGEVVVLPSSGLVWGDVVLVDEGDVVPVDARLISADDLRVDNASLTGESRPVYKAVDTPPGAPKTWFLWTELPDMVFAGTTVTSGSGSAVVTGTAMGTEIGKIARLTQNVARVPSPLQKEMATLVNVLTVVSVALGLGFFVLGTLLGGLAPVTAFLFTIGITVANIPEGLLPTLSLSLAMGVQRLSRRGVLVKSLAAVETLGSTQVICTDKTGTLTTNKISVTQLWSGGTPVVLGPGLGTDAAGLFLVAVLCNNAHLGENGAAALGDPTETALLALAVRVGLDVDGLRGSWVRLRHFPFDSVRKRMGTIHSGPEGAALVLVKGAPLELLACCSSILDGREVRPLTPDDARVVRSQIDALAQVGLRTLGFASKPVPPDGLAELTREECETDLCFLGFSGMEDPPRPEVPAAIASCLRAGIRLVMVTGDYGLTARAIARQIGLTSDAQPGTHLSGRDLDRLDDGGLDRLLLADEGPLIFSRFDPAQKMRVVGRFKAAGLVVAVTGDGVNDAAALKMADIGIAMGKNVSDVAREAAAMVVLDGSFASIVDAIAEGRAVYANIRRFVTYVLSSNVPELAPFLFFVLFHVPLALTVMQILAIDLGTDVVPALGLGVEAPEPGLMDRPPRSRKDHLVDVSLGIRAYLWLGMTEVVLSGSAFVWGCFSRGWVPGTPLPGTGPAYAAATTLTLVGIVACQVGNVFACRTRRASVFQVGFWSNRLVLVGIAVESALVALLVYTPFFQEIFGLAPLGPVDWLFVASFPVVLLGVEELRKLVVRIGNRRR